MKKIILVIYLLMASSLSAQTSHEKFEFNCALCHSCENPTKTNPCLKPCPRADIITVHHSAKEGPDEIIMDNFKETEDNFEAVKFSHRAHSEMSIMSGGCEMCHHYNPPGRVASCKDCHEINRLRQDLRKPDLKAAYHRQCIDCHKIWNPNVLCADCHAKNGGEKSIELVAGKTSKEYHPEIESPTRLVYDTSEDMDGVVTFYHDEHINLFGLQCNDCHQQESCAKCHNKVKEKVDTELSLEEKHATCSKCHDTENDCESCHQPEISPRFNHSKSTGFSLVRNHAKLTCMNCHKTEKKFSRLNSDCINCHKSWNLENFNHSVTGLELSEIHVEFECENCHSENGYQNPTCDNCHDEITYPDMSPGEKIN